MPAFDVVDLEAQPFAYVGRMAPMEGIGPAMAACFEELGGALSRAGVAAAGPPLTHYLSYNDRETTFHVGFPVRAGDADRLRQEGLLIGATHSGRAMTAIHTGPYDTLMRTYTAIMGEMKARGLQPTIDMWEAYMSPPGTPPQETRTEVIWPVAGAA